MFIKKPIKREMIRNRRMEKLAQLSLFSKRWPILNKNIELMFTNKLDDISFGEVYKVTYELVLYNFGKQLYEQVGETLQSQLKKMYEEIKNATDENFLKTITTTYVSYRLVLTILSSTMYYLDEVYSIGDVKKLFDYGLKLFADCVISEEVLEKLRVKVLGLIQKDREGEAIESELIKNAVTILDDLKNYGPVIEEPLLKESKEYYNKKAEFLITKVSSVSEYCHKVQEIVVDEMSRVKKYLISTTGPKLDDVVREVMVTKHIKFVFEDKESGFIALMKQRDVKQLGTMYFLFSKNDTQLKVMQEQFKNYVFETGKKYVTSEAIKTPQDFIKEIVQMKATYDDMISESFSKNEDFSKSLNEGFAGFADGTIQPQMASLLSLYVDITIKNHLDDYEKHFDTAISIFRYLRDQEMFETYYKIHLSKRLFISRIPNEHAEKKFIGLLKKESGYQFTAKIEGMFSDIRLSKITMENFEKSTAFVGLKKNVQSVELNVSTLTSSFWPQYEFSSPLLPDEMKHCVGSFEKYYKSVHKSRKLTWQNNLGNGIVLARFPVSKHEVSLTTYQMVILLLFNNHNELKFSEIVEKTSLTERECKRNLLLLSIGKYKLLTKAPRSKTVNPDDLFGWNADFKSNNTRIRIGNIVVKQGGIGVGSGSGRKDKKDEKREEMIEKALIVTLRQKKKIMQPALMKKARELLKNKLDPPVESMEIKKRVEDLIIREFVKRSEDNRKLLEYIA